MADWQAIKTEYITTDTTYRKLAEKYGVSRVQIGNVGKKENWVEQRRHHLDRTFTKTVAAVESAKVKRAEKVQSVADKLLSKIEAIADSDRVLMAKDIRSLTAAAKDLKDILVGKSELDEQEQKARIAVLNRNAQGDKGKEPEKLEVLGLPEEFKA